MKQALNEQIAVLRKQKGMTQEEVAAVLGVSGQAVSKWESGICCPDIGLLPALADTFGVTLDALMGRAAPAEAPMTEPVSDPIEVICRHQSALSREEAAVFACQAARALHARLFAGYMNMPSPDDVIAHAKVGEWGLSAISEPTVTTRMYRDAVFFSANGEYGATDLPPEQVKRLCSFLRNLSKGADLTVLHALYRLTAWDEDGYASASAIGQACRLKEEAVEAILDGDLSELVVSRRSDGVLGWRICGECMDVIPILSLLVRL